MTNSGPQPPPRRERPSVDDGAVGVSRPVPGRCESAELRLPLSWVIGGAVLLSVLMVGGIIAAFLAGRGVGSDPAPVETDEPQPSSFESPDVAAEFSVLESAVTPAEPPPPDAAPRVSEEQASPFEMAKSDEPPRPEPDEPAAIPLPLADVINVHKEHLPLPPTEQNRTLIGGGASAVTEAAQLAKIYVDDPEQVTLRIEGQEAILPPGVQFTITEELSPDRSMKTWEISETNPTGVAAIGTKVGRFRLHDNQLSFQWQQNLKSARLQFCRLIIEAEHDDGIQTASCSLFEPVQQAPLRLHFDAVTHVVDLNLDPRSLPRPEHLQMEIAIRGIDRSQYQVSGNSLTPTSPYDPSGAITIDFYHPDGQRRPEDRMVRTVIQLAANAGRVPHLILRNFAFLNQVRLDKQPRRGLPPDIQVGPPTEPIEFARSSEDRIRQETLKVFRELQGYRSQLTDVLVARRQKFSSVNMAKSRKSERLQQSIARSRAELEQAVELEERYALAEVVLERMNDRLRELSQIHQQLEQNVQVDTRLFLIRDGTQIDLLQTNQRAGQP